MLFGEDLGGCHEGNLVAIFDGLKCRECGDDGFSAADIAQQQTLHRMWFCQIAADLAEYFLLCAGQFERQVFQQFAGEMTYRFERRRCALASFLVMHAHRELLRQQFIEFDTPPGGMTAIIKRVCSNIRRMQHPDACRKII